jgi:uncharacterized membrane protein YkvA (DUF1232 family)
MMRSWQNRWNTRDRQPKTRLPVPGIKRQVGQYPGMNKNIDNSTDGFVSHSSEASSDAEQRGFVVSRGLRYQAQRVHLEAHVFYCVFKHPRTPWYAKLVAACTAGYLLSPIQLIPSFIPVIGFLDDFLVLILGVKLLKRITPRDVLAQCRGIAKAAEARRKEKIRTSVAVAASIAVVTMWLLATVAASALVAASIPR